jgi:hypothetical protein
VSSWIHRQRHEQAFECHSKGGFGSLFTPTKATRRVRAIAADRTRASLTGGCPEPGFFRIYTEFCSAEGEPGRPAQPGRATSASEGLIRIAGDQEKPRHGVWGSGCAGGYGAGRRPYSPTPQTAVEPAFAGRAVRSRSRTETQRPASVPSSESIDRFDRRGVHATVQEVLARAIAASQHWRIIRSWAAQHF